MTAHRNFFALFLSSASLLAILQILGVYFYFFWKEPWIDIPMHILGGALVALSTFAFLWYVNTHHVSISHRAIIVTLVVATIAIGLLWEYYEILARLMFFNEPGYLFDTAKDIFDDTLGSLGVVYFLIRQYGLLLI